MALKRPTYEACKAYVAGGHSDIAWTCRSCSRQACAACAHRYGSARSPVVLKGEQERVFTCSRCSGGKAPVVVLGRVTADLSADLSALIREHGAADVLIALRDGCKACADVGGSVLATVAFRAASEHLEEAAVQVAAVHGDNAPTLDMGLDVLADVDAAAKGSVPS